MAAAPRQKSAIAAIGHSIGGVELDLQRDNTPVKPAEFE